MYKITRKSFGDWLSKFNDDDVVGYVGLSCDCPIAEFYKQVYDLRADVSTKRVLYFNRREQAVRVALPQWGTRFVEYVDGLSDRFSHPVTASSAKAAFNFAIFYEGEFVV